METRHRPTPRLFPARPVRRARTTFPPPRAADEQVLDAHGWMSFARWMLDLEPADALMTPTAPVPPAMWPSQVRTRRARTQTAQM